jgi:hypothetical protein
MPDSRKASTLPAMKSGINQEGPKAWTPGYDDAAFRNVLPIDWTCPCGKALHGAKSCPNCGRVPMDNTRKRLDGYQSMDTGRELKQWRKFGKRGRR